MLAYILVIMLQDILGSVCMFQSQDLGFPSHSFDYVAF